MLSQRVRDELNRSTEWGLDPRGAAHDELPAAVPGGSSRRSSLGGGHPTRGTSRGAAVQAGPMRRSPRASAGTSYRSGFPGLRMLSEEEASVDRGSDGHFDPTPPGSPDPSGDEYLRWVVAEAFREGMRTAGESTSSPPRSGISETP